MPQDLGENQIIHDAMARITPERAVTLDKHRLLPGDIVYSRRGDVTRRSLVRDSDPDMICGTGCLRVRLDTSLANPTYVSYALGMPSTREWITRHAVGATMANLNTQILGEVPLSLPDLESQQAIAEVLGALDDKIAANSRVIGESTELQEAVWKQRTKGLPLEPLTHFAGIHLGGTPPRTKEDAWGPGVAWASVKDITAAPNGLLVETVESITEETSLSAPRLNALPTGTTLLTARGTVGVVATNVIPCAINQSAYALLSKNVGHVSLRLAVESLAASFRSRAHGSVFNTITMSTLEESLIPDLASESAAAANPILESLEKQRVAVQLENIALARTRDELLPLLMNGRMKVRDAQARVEEVV